MTTNPEYFKNSSVPDPTRTLVDLTNDKLESMGLGNKKLDLEKLLDEAHSEPAKPSSHPSKSSPESPRPGWVI